MKTLKYCNENIIIIIIIFTSLNIEIILFIKQNNAVKKPVYKLCNCLIQQQVNKNIPTTLQ